jgi:pimeloyl-ACP methyl ester carboxylesterase
LATYVLVGGAWMGGWVWQAVARDLRRRGHDVYPATPTGLGERVHLARPEVDLETHLADVANLIAYEGLRDVVLAGHSYAGIVVTGVADRVGDRLSHLVYVDSAPFEDGESYVDVQPPEVQEQLRRQVETEGDGWRIPPLPFADLPMTPSLAGLSEEDRALLEARSTPQPFRTYTQPLRLTHAHAGTYARAVIACNDFRQLIASGIPRFQTFTPPEWRVEHLETGHWPMLSAPAELADVLHRLATDR